MLATAQASFPPGPALGRDDYHVGLVFALPEELAAGKAMLDEEHKMIPGQDPQDTNSYTLGRIHQHNVVLACLPARVDGVVSAAAVAVNMLRTFTALRFGLMVGIGGGIPTTNHDIRLGDILVSEPDGTSGGVVQYTKGKLRPDGFERKGTLNMPPPALLTALASIKAEHEMRESRVSLYHSDMLDRYPRMKKKGYGYPGMDQDVLFCSCADVKDKACNSCKDGKIARHARDTHLPEIHYGIIASGDLVIKDAGTRNSLSEEYGAVCVEMEAAGLMNNFPCLVVRGICDYADSHKNDDWHKYAAATAAAFAKEFLLYVSPEMANHEKPIQQIMGFLTEQLETTKLQVQESRQQNRTNDVRYIEDKQHACHSSFRVSSYEADKNRNPERVPGTCLWALNHQTFQDWQHSTHDDLLWISADPGCGKSVLARSLIDNELKRMETHTVCYYFFKENDLQDRLHFALCSMLHQLFDAHPALVRYAIPAWEKNKEKLQFETTQLWQILINAATDEAIGHITCIFDALDECREADQAELVQDLCRYYENAQESVRQGRLRFLITSRPYGSIERHFHSLPTNLRTMRLRGEEENDTLRCEIDLVVRKKVLELANDFDLDAQTREEIEEKLIAMEHRTYLWLHLAFNGIRHIFEYSPRPAQEAIETLPSDVEDAYEKILGRVPQGQRSMVGKILQIVAGARRALSVKEMSVALGVATADRVEFQDDTHIDTDRLEKHIRNWCGLFVFINHSRIYLIHQTAKEFLMSTAEAVRSSSAWRHSFSVASTEAFMGCICVDFLSLKDVDWKQTSEKLNSAEYLIEGNGIVGFFAYSAQYWPVHFASVHTPADSQLMDFKFRLYDPSSAVYRHWFARYCSSTGFPSTEDPELPEPLEVAIACGHEDVFHSLLVKHGNKLNLVNASGERALHYACMYGHTDIARMLVERGVNVNSTFRTEHPLVWAVLGSHIAIVEILLAAGANIHVEGEWEDHGYGNALIIAAARGYGSIVQLLLDNGADVNAKASSGYFGTALIAACSGGHAAMVEQLLGQGADPHLHAQEGRSLYGTALIAAATLEDTTTVQLLLDTGVDVNTQPASGGYGTALIAACARGVLPTLRLLLDQQAGVNIDVHSGYYGTALIAACCSRDGLEKVQLLLDRKADVHAYARTGEYGTALIAACFERSLAVVRLLLDWQADVNMVARMGNYGTALIAACCRGDGLEKVQLLLDRKADVHAYARSGECGTALIAACGSGNCLTARALLEHGAEVNAQVQVGDDVNALTAAADLRDEELRNTMTKLLLQWGAVKQDGSDTSTQMEPLRK